VRSPSSQTKTGYPRRFRLLAVSLLLLLAAPCGFCTSMDYQIGSGSVIADNAEPGLVIQSMVKPTVAGTSFTLNDSGSFTFAFFDIWTNEPKIESDDLVGSPISATLNFLNPFTGATVNGITVGGKWMSGLSQWGTLTWNGPVTVNVPNDRSFTITLSDATFNYGFGSLQSGQVCGATVSATITQISSTAPPENNPPSVPEGGRTALLLGSSLVGLRLFARNKTRRRG